MLWFYLLTMNSLPKKKICAEKCEHMILYGIDGVSACQSVIVVPLGTPFLAGMLLVCSLILMARGGFFCEK